MIQSLAVSAWVVALSSRASASWISTALGSSVGLSTIWFVVKFGPASIALGFSRLVLSRWWNVLDVVLGEMVEVGRCEFDKYSHVSLDITAHFPLWILNERKHCA